MPVPVPSRGQDRGSLGTAAELLPRAEGHEAEGFLHEMGVYASDEEFRDLICPFAIGGLEAGEPVVFAYDPRKMDLLQHWLPAAAGITYVTDSRPYAKPAKALAKWREVIEGHLAAGARRVRIAGDVPHPGFGRPYIGWDRYEAAIDRAWGDLPFWAPCLYDARIAPPEVLDAATRRHHHFLDGDGTHRANVAFHPAGQLADFLASPPDPLEATKPAFELFDPTPARARAAISQLADQLVGVEQVHDLEFAVSEVVTNALVRGVPPVSVRIWAGRDRVVVNVHDDGGGPVDPLAGLLPTGAHAGSGRGLWLAHLLDVEVELIVAGDGFTVRLRASNYPM